MIALGLKDKVAIVTGSRRGMGRAIALALARAGANVVVSDLNRNDCENVAREIEGLGSKPLILQVNVTKSVEVDEMVQSTMDKFGKIDVLVNNAGVGEEPSPFYDISEDAWDRIIGVNLKGVFLCSRAVAKVMIPKRTGKIINIASFNGEAGGNIKNLAAYNVSKAGVIMLTKSMALELGPHKINVNAISPGIIKTPMTESALSDPQVQQKLLTHTPLGRLGVPEDVARAAIFLASDQADYVTGAVLVVDGGRLSGSHL